MTLLDNDTITCDVDWAGSNVITKNIYVTVRDGPVFDYQDPAFTSDPNHPVWLTGQRALYNDTGPDYYRIINNVSLSSLLAKDMSAYQTRVVGCTAVGFEPATLLPVIIAALSKVILNVSASPLVWEDFTYPIYTKPCFAAGCISTVGERNRDSRALIATEGQASGVSFIMANYASNQLLLANNQSLHILQSPMISTSETLDELRPFDGTTPSLKDITGLSITPFGIILTGSSLTTASNTVISYIPANNMSTEYQIDVGAADAECTMDQGAIVGLKARHLSGLWVDPVNYDLYAVDSGCGLLYRYRQLFVDPILDPFRSPLGHCGVRSTVANLTADASFKTDFERRTSIAGDVTNGILYIAYGGACGVMAYNLTTMSKIGFVTSIDIPITENITVTTPVCGYAGELDILQAS